MVATAEVPKGVAAERLRRHYRRRHVMARVGLYVAAVLAAFICAGPFLWSLVTAFKQNRDLYNPENSPFFFNLAATPDHLLYLLRDTALTSRNTLVGFWWGHNPVLGRPRLPGFPGGPAWRGRWPSPSSSSTCHADLLFLSCRGWWDTALRTRPGRW